MKGAGILSVRWAVAAVVVAALILPQGLGAQVPGQGIKVHGRWVVEVRNPDGTLALRREFENALVEEGRQALARLLSGEQTLREWQITVIQCATNTPCALVEPSSQLNFPFPSFKNLVVTVANTHELVLQGSFMAPGDASVSEVRTTLWTVGAVFAVFGFTDATLQSPIPVQ